MADLKEQLAKLIVTELFRQGHQTELLILGSGGPTMAEPPACEQWDAVRDLLVEEFPRSERHLRVSSNGIELTVLVNESQARRVLQLLGFGERNAPADG